MFVEIDNLKTYYETSGEGKPIVLLHGWGGNHNSWYPITQNLQKYFKVITLDFPGFGQSQLSSQEWEIEDYAKHFQKFLTNIEIFNEKPTLIGHSFGGTVSIKYASLYLQNIEKLVLVNAKAIKEKKDLKKKLYKVVAKTGKTATNILDSKIQKKLKEKLYNHIGEHDYEQLEGVLKKNFINIINEDLSSDLEKIKVPSLIIWGENDKDTPLSDAKIINKLLDNSRLKVFPNTGHISYLERPEEFCKTVRKFIQNISQKVNC